MGPRTAHRIARFPRLRHWELTLRSSNCHPRPQLVRYCMEWLRRVPPNPVLIVTTNERLTVLKWRHSDAYVTIEIALIYANINWRLLIMTAIIRFLREESRQLFACVISILNIIA